MMRRALALVRERLSELRASARTGAGRCIAFAARAGAVAHRLLWPPGPRAWAALFAAGIAALGVHGWWFHASLPGRLPSALDWRAAAAVLGRDARPGDAVALDPWWAERAREALPASIPVMAFPRLAGEDLVGVRRVWLLSLPRAPGRRLALTGDLSARAAAITKPQRLGGLELSRFDLRSPTLPLAFLPDRLSTATVSVGDRACARDARGVFRCPAAPFVIVSREVREVDYLPRPCLYAHPAPGEPLAIRFPSVPLGRALRGHTGIVGEAALDGEAPVRLTVKIDGEEAGAAEELPGEPGWHPFQIETLGRAGRTGDVTFVVTSADVDRRHFCFDAFVLP